MPELVQGWRLASAEYSRTVKAMLSGDGTLRNGGRWNSPGQRVVYLAASLALASLELLVHLRETDVLKGYRKLPVGIPEHLVKAADVRALPTDWARTSLHPATQRTGDRWLASLESAVLVVPSAVVIGEVNYIVNPAHPDFALLEPGEITDYRYDPRILKTSAGR
ncbi:MAG: RES family NAD+ phosphorylase [Gammaproteobacteria bacterium]|nr:RES family NAD+ phosphorylase [Gammaproteobacteria bacterium]